MEGRKSIAQILVNRAERDPLGTALRYRAGGKAARKSWEELLASATAMAWMLKTQGLGRGGRVVVLGESSRAVVEALLGVWLADGVAVPLLHTTPNAELLPLLARVQPDLVLVSGPASLRGLGGFSGKAPVILLDGEDSVSGKRFRGAGIDGLAADSEALGFKPHLAEDLAGDPDPAYHRVPEFTRSGADDAVLLFTPGTGGAYKGTVLSHAAMIEQATQLGSLIGIGPDDSQLLILPLSYILGLSSLVTGLLAGAVLCLGGGQRSIVEDMGTFQPTYFVGVPYLFERLADRIRSAVADLGFLEKTVFQRLVDASVRHIEAASPELGEDILGSVERMLADRVLFPRLRGLFGGHLRFFISAGAPVQRSTVVFFHAIGIPLYEGYGLTETAGATHINGPGAFRPGSVGVPLDGVQVRIGEDGEILLKSPSMLSRYLDPVEPGYGISDGWLQTGDLGYTDESGFLFITGRKKDLFVTSSGAIVSPAKLETRLDQLSLVSRAAIFGDSRDFPIALLTLDPESARHWYEERGLTFNSLPDAARNVDLYIELEQSIKRINNELSPQERIKRFAILPAEFSCEGGDLTPHQRLRRDRIAEKYDCIIKNLYE